MSRFKKILLATDFSECARHAKEYAFALGKSFGGELHVLHVIDEVRLSHWGPYGSGGDVTLRSVMKRSREELARLEKQGVVHDVETLSHVATGKPSATIVQRAEDLGAELIVLGTHGHSGFSQMFIGGTCEKVTRLSRIPVLTIKYPEHEFIAAGDKVMIDKILCPCDFSSLSRVAIPYAADLCREYGAQLTLMHVFDTRIDYPKLLPGVHETGRSHLHAGAVELLEAVGADFSGIHIKVEVAVGKPHRELVAFEEQTETDLIVMATHGRTGINHAVLGSITEKVVRAAACPVLTIRPTEKAVAKAKAQFRKLEDTHALLET